MTGPSRATARASRAARISEPKRTLVHEIDLSYIILPWSSRLRNGAAFREAFGDRVGYRASETYAEGVTLGTAMSLSGAAVSPNWGYHSSPLSSFVMMLFNIRLGAGAYLNFNCVILDVVAVTIGARNVSTLGGLWENCVVSVLRSRNPKKAP